MLYSGRRQGWTLGGPGLGGCPCALRALLETQTGEHDRPLPLLNRARPPPSLGLTSAAQGPRLSPPAGPHLHGGGTKRRQGSRGGHGRQRGGADTSLRAGAPRTPHENWTFAPPSRRASAPVVVLPVCPRVSRAVRTVPGHVTGGTQARTAALFPDSPRAVNNVNVLTLKTPVLHLTQTSALHDRVPRPCNSPPFPPRRPSTCTH